MLDTQTKFTATLFLLFSKWLAYVLSLSTYNFTCKAVLLRTVVHFKAQRFEQDVRVHVGNIVGVLFPLLHENYFYSSSWLCECHRVHRLLTNLETNQENKLYRRKMNCMNSDLALLIVSVYRDLISDLLKPLSFVII